MHAKCCAKVRCRSPGRAHLLVKPALLHLRRAEVPAAPPTQRPSAHAAACPQGSCTLWACSTGTAGHITTPLKTQGLSRRQGAGEHDGAASVAC